MDLRVDAFIPEKYIPDGAGRIEAYKRIACLLYTSLRSASAVSAVLPNSTSRAGERYIFSSAPSRRWVSRSKAVSYTHLYYSG